MNRLPSLAASLLFAILPVSIASEPHPLDCDFNSGLDKWRGDGRLFSEADGNGVCRLKKTGKRQPEIHQDIDLEPGEEYEVHYRVRALPGSEKVNIRRAVRTSKGFTYSEKKLKPGGVWESQKFNVSKIRGDRANEREIAIVFYGGEGIVEIDDIKVVIKR